MKLECSSHYFPPNSRWIKKQNLKIVQVFSKLMCFANSKTTFPPVQSSLLSTGWWWQQGPLTKAGLVVGIHIEVFAPFHHALENGHEALQAFLPQTELLRNTVTGQRHLTDKLSVHGYRALRESRQSPAFGAVRV